MKNFQKGVKGEVLKFVTPDGGLGKKMQKVFCKNNSILRSFRLNFGFKDLFGAAQIVHKIKIKRTEGYQLNYLTFFHMILCVWPRTEVNIF